MLCLWLVVALKPCGTAGSSVLAIQPGWVWLVFQISNKTFRSASQCSMERRCLPETDIAQNAAHVVLMRPSLSDTLALLDLSKALHRCVISDFLWSFTYNVVATLLAAGACPKAQIPPQFAEVGRVFSVLPVTAIAGLFRFEGVKQHLN